MMNAASAAPRHLYILLLFLIHHSAFIMLHSAQRLALNSGR